MKDIVDRLKEQSGWIERNPYMGRTGDMLWDAIEEIEKLRASQRRQVQHQRTEEK